MKTIWRYVALTLSLAGGISAGAAICYWQMMHSLKRDLVLRIEQAITSTDKTLSHAEKAASMAERFLGKHCDDTVLTGIRTIVATVPDVRTVNLVRDDEIYCTSVFGGQNFKNTWEGGPAAHLLLMAGNKVTPARSLLVYRSGGRDGFAALTGVDGYYLYNILQILHDRPPLYLNVGNRFMSQDGRVFSALNIAHPVSKKSTRFDYTIIADGIIRIGWTDFVRSQSGPLMMTVLFTLILTFLFSRYLLYINTIEFLLRNAIKRRDITPWIQTIVDADSGRLMGGEILLRWQHPQRGFIPPDVFITVAEQNGMIKEITRECFSSVITAVKDIEVECPEPLIFCFNISAGQFRDEDIVSLCRKFQASVFSRSLRIVLEITEREFIEISQPTTRIINRLKGMGVTFSLDDFGTGNANYSFIPLFEPEFLKIDKSFISGVGKDEFSTTVVESIISLADKTGCKVIAEGIENKEQRFMLQSMGAHLLQGYLFSRPVPLQDFLKQLS
ncbi:cyclic diguanylate phosphodiesterase [Escherichia coli]|uniref:EAL domain-containing protein n=1 Tax=Escherichia coli TaxID=562 RepID=UPI001F06D5A0|nr:cyclic diguanylate phosphodiesterase [Escherichia coli]MCH0581429.1 cyclic diguanylate phosphodiesterase [Escherichia coli]